MKLLKGALIFVSGAVTFSLLLAKSLVHRADNPYEGSIVCETDEFKVISMNPHFYISLYERSVRLVCKNQTKRTKKLLQEK